MDPLNKLFGWFVGNRRLPGFVTAVVSVGAGMAIRLALLGTFRGFPFVTFYPAVLLTALVGGWIPAAAAAAVALPFSWYFLIGPGPGFHWSPSTIIGAASDTLVVAVIIVLVEIIRAAARSLQAKQAQTEALLDERDAMFRELQHRVANNMQFVASLLARQAARIADGDPSKGVLREGASRLVLLGGLHRKLHDLRLSASGFDVVAREILTDLLRGSGFDHVTLDIRAEPIRLPLDVLTSVMLIATEAATNSIKHVFSKGAGTRLAVTLQRAEVGEAILTIADDGPGFPAGATAGTQGLGLIILQSLAQRLAGKLEMQTTHGAVVAITFPVPASIEPEPIDAWSASPPIIQPAVADGPIAQQA